MIPEQQIALIQEALLKNEAERRCLLQIRQALEGLARMRDTAYEPAAAPDRHITLLAAIRQVLEDAPNEGLTLDVIRTRTQALGAASPRAKDGDKSIDTLARRLGARGLPVRKIRPRTWAWVADEHE